MKTNSINQEIISLFRQAKEQITKKDPTSSIMNQCFYLDESIICLRNPIGDSRYPYSKDGLTLWAYTSGNISINESNFFVIPFKGEGKEPYLNFYGGILNNNKYKVFSLLGCADTEYGDNNQTYVIYKKSEAYYLREIDNELLSCVKTTITDDKKILFTTCLINISNNPQEVLSSFYLNPLLMHDSNENEETKWFRKVEIKEGNALFTSVEDLSREVHLYNYGYLSVKGNEDTRSIATKRMDYVGDKNKSISLSKCLRQGSFDRTKEISTFTDMAVYGDISRKTIQPNESLVMNYQFRIAFDEKEVKGFKNDKYEFGTNYENFNKNEREYQNKLRVEFGEFNKRYKLNNDLFNKFLGSVIEQIDYSSSTKNSSLMLLGIRDVYQMMEVSLLWNKEVVRNKIIESLSFVDLDGRAPRQYSSIVKAGECLMDNRAFIDQGNWIISTLYKYLAFTNDFDILNEKCGYTKLVGRKQGFKINQQETVYEHLVRIMNYLINNIDSNTNCLKALYGDWNDAVDGLGQSDDPSKDFGNGVSVMATLHLYQNLHEMHEINEYLKKDDNYLDIASKVEEGIRKNAIQKKDNEYRIVHGWANNQKFFVGSFNDVDHVSRISSTSNAFFVLSGLFDKHPEYKDTIINAAKQLDSKYGMMTFTHYFDKKNASEVGRIVNLPKGTAENGAVYIHGGMFLVRALLKMDETDFAFDQILKYIPITHDFVTTSPFTMPNSYGYNKKLNIDGESMSDWYTGSSNTLLKAIIFDMFGIKPLLGNKVEINPVNKFPSNEASISLEIKGKKVTIKHINKENAKREIFLNEKPIATSTIDFSYDNELINVVVIN